MERWSQELSNGQSSGCKAVTATPAAGTTNDVIGDASRAESLLQHHNEALNHMQNAVFSVLQRGQEILLLMEANGHRSGPPLLHGSESCVQNLLESLHQAQMDLDDVAELRRVALELDVQIVPLQAEANQVLDPLVSSSQFQQLNCY